MPLDDHQDCINCALLEAIRYSRIRQYLELSAQRRHGLVNPRVERSMELVRAELDEAWKRLAEHWRTRHPNGRPAVATPTPGKTRLSRIFVPAPVKEIAASTLPASKTGRHSSASEARLEAHYAPE